MKKWWLLAVVFTLALSLTSCSSGPSNYTGGSAALDCNGPKDSFLVELDPVNGTTYDLVLTPQSVSTEGVVAQIALIGDSINQLDVVKQMITLYSGLPIHISVTLDDLQNFSQVGVAHVDRANPSLSFPQMTAGAICQLPLPGDGNQSQYYGN